ncbi:methyltransferase [Actinoallomurus sp. CA-150999]|uniref:methyltransferase n=1 Tax=Actinoallomurus sp. CA-150999 TaxID=3239887 RepID=UPI003D92D5FA
MEPSEAVAIGRLSNAFAQAKLLHSAVELGVFELLANGPAGEVEIRQRLGLHPRLSRDFLDALVALELLTRSGEGYANAPQAAAFLVPGGAYYLGDLCRTAAARHYAMWGRLSEALRDGEPKADRVGGPDAFKKVYQDPEAARRFLAHMDSAHALVGPQLAAALDWTRHGSFVDVGGARGNLAAQLAQAHPHLNGAVFELPQVEPVFDEHMARLGTADRVRFHGGDFFADPLPAADVVILGHVLHDWPADQARVLVERAHDAVTPGGLLLVYDQMLDPVRPDLPSLLGSLNVALTTGGSEYTVADCREWAEKAGFRVAETRRLTTIGNDMLLIAAKDG